MPLIRKLHRIDHNVEKRVITSFLVSDSVLSQLHPYLQPYLFELEVSQILIRWINDYYKSYKKSPKQQIQDIFLKEKSSLPPNKASDVQEFLQTISSEYTNESSNEDFRLDQAKQFLRLQAIRKTHAEVGEFLDRGEIDKAEEVLNNNRRIISETKFDWVAPYDDMDFVAKVFEEMEHPLLELKGKLGELVGPLRRGWLMGVMAGFKRGKTAFFQDLAFDATTSRCKVAFISCEMENRQMGERIYRHLGAFSNTTHEVVIPIFDCWANADNSCKKSFRLGKGKRPKVFDPSHLYKPCDECRRKPQEEKDYMMSTWSKLEKHSAASYPGVRKEIRKLQRMIGSNKFRLISFPRFTATISDIENSLEELDVKECFIPDIVIVDYADILAPEIKGDKKDIIDDIWKKLSRMAGERHVLVITGSQITRAGLNKAILDETDTPENILKLAHVDIMMVMDQTPQEKERHFIRFGVMEHRHKEFFRTRQVLALQQFEIGQPFIDGEFVNANQEYFANLMGNKGKKEEEE